MKKPTLFMGAGALALFGLFIMTSVVGHYNPLLFCKGEGNSLPFKYAHLSGTVIGHERPRAENGTSSFEISPSGKALVDKAIGHSKSVRMIYPGIAVNLDYRPRRLNIEAEYNEKDELVISGRCHYG